MLITKSEFAAHRGVSRGAVSHWIRLKKLDGPALRPDGKIDVEAADRQLAARLSPVHAASARARSGNAGAVAIDLAAAAQLLKARAVIATVDAERKRRELMAERGKFMPTAEAEARWSKMLSDFLTDVEQSLSDLAQTLGLDREKTLLLRRWWRNERAKAAAANRAAAEREAEFVEDLTA